MLVERREQEKDGITYTERNFKDQDGKLFTVYETSKGNILYDFDGDNVVDARTFVEDHSSFTEDCVDLYKYTYADENMDGTFDKHSFTSGTDSVIDSYESKRDPNDNSWMPYERTQLKKDLETGEWK
jgi:hypothetical protein